MLYSSVTVLKYQESYYLFIYLFLLQQLEMHPCWIYRCGVSKDINIIIIGETFIHLRASLFI